MPLESRGRHAQEAPPAGPMAWRCPACGEEQVGQLEAGCDACGAGKAAAKHVGVDPIVRKWQPGTLQSPPDPEADPLAKAFERWRLAHPGLTAGIPVGVLEAIFYAGWQAAQVQTLMVTEPATDAISLESRTIIAALKLFKNQILSDPAELESGEWLSPEAIDSLIQQLEKTA